ncbi:MAG: VWA domain-containing protein [Candidatus Heimdallarchaeota archaeon]|nr:VWA domain-containing protein [Candidatus Heimdallarchaeota archaeon]
MSEMSMVLKFEDGLNNKAKVNDADAKKLGLLEGSIVRIADEYTGLSMGTIITLDENVGDEEIVIDKSLGISMGFTEGPALVEKYDKALDRLKKVTIGIEPKGGGGAEEATKKFLEIQERRGELEQFLNGLLIYPEAQFVWDKFDVNLKVLETEPQIGTDNFAMISREELEEIKLRTIGDKNFNGILMIDVSGSMTNKDMLFKGITSIEGLQAHMDGETLSFLQGFKEGEEIERYKGATIAALLYVAEKVARGRGEKVAFIPFTSDPTVISFGNKNWFESSQKTDKNISDVMKKITDTVEDSTFGGTNMSDTLEKALEIVDEFNDPEKLNMFVLLTDGYPNNEDKVKNICREIGLNRKNIILYTIGIGEANYELLTEIAAETGGESRKPNDLQELLNWYSELANDIERRVKLK